MTIMKNLAKTILKLTRNLIVSWKIEFSEKGGCTKTILWFMQWNTCGRQFTEKTGNQKHLKIWKTNIPKSYKNYVGTVIQNIERSWTYWSIMDSKTIKTPSKKRCRKKNEKRCPGRTMTDYRPGGRFNPPLKGGLLGLARNSSRWPGRPGDHLFSGYFVDRILISFWRPFSCQRLQKWTLTPLNIRPKINKNPM